MKTVSLEEAMKLATKGPYSTCSGSFADQIISRPEFDAAIASGMDEDTAYGEALTCEMGGNEVNAAVLTHCFNLFPEVVEALKDTVDRLETWWEAAGCPPHETEIHITEVREFLAKATTIELPE
jgi:hypothetical protein